MPSFKTVSHTACAAQLYYVDGKQVSREEFAAMRDACSIRDSFLTVTDRVRRKDGCEAHVYTFEGR